MKHLSLIWLLLCGIVVAANAQWPQKLQIIQGELSGRDTIPHVDLPEVGVFPPRVFKNKSDEQQYWRLVMRVKKVLPYAKEAAALYKKYEREVPVDSRNRDRRVYVRKAEEELMRKYGPVMKKMSINDGKILIKLIDRETQHASYEIIQEVKGSVPALFWQGVARVFGNNLKTKYDPSGEDRQIEIIIHYIEMGII